MFFLKLFWPSWAGLFFFLGAAQFGSDPDLKKKIRVGYKYPRTRGGLGFPPYLHRPRPVSRPEPRFAAATVRLGAPPPSPPVRAPLPPRPTPAPPRLPTRRPAAIPLAAPPLLQGPPPASRLAAAPARPAAQAVADAFVPPRAA